MTKAMRRRLEHGKASPDLGMTLVEVMVACMVLMILSAGIVATLLTAFKTTRNDRVRVAASNLAARELEIVRQYFASGSTAVANVVNPANEFLTNPDPLSGVPNTPSVIDGVSYTVKRNVEVQVLGPGVSACDGGSTVAHPSYAVTATVTWAGAANPVVNETVLTPPKGVIADATYGYLAVKVTDSRSANVPGVTVQIAGPAGTLSAVTDTSGCAVAAINTAGTNYTATLSTSGYVDYNFVTAPVLSPITVSVGALTTKTMTYDKAAELDATFATTAGHSLPQTLPSFTLYNTGIQPSKIKVVSSTGATTQLKNLWPFVSGYTIWASSCTDADPGITGTRPVPVVVNPGGVGATQVPLTPLDVTVLDNTGAPSPNQVVTALEQTTPGCIAADKTLTLGTTSAAGKLATSLPIGSWKLKVGATSGGAFNVTAAAASAEVDLP